MPYHDYDRDDAYPDCRQVSAETRRARKPRKCDICDKPITAGEVYYRAAWVCEGEFQATAQHWACQPDAEPPF
jgi:hypothetical protein